MEQHRESGTKKDLVLYRIDIAKSDVKAAQILMEAKKNIGEQTTELIMEFIMRFQQSMH